MGSKCRTIDPQLYQKAEFRRASYVQREVWIGVITTCCDDEGRFEADPWNLCELIFSRAHDATESSVTEALQYWCSCGWLLLYEDGKYGFLTGWYEHQYIKTPEPSSYPAPPVEINSWRAVKHIKEWHKAERGGSENTHFRTVIREYEQSVATDGELSTHLLHTKSVASEVQNGIERNRTEGEENPTEEKQQRLPASGAAEPPKPAVKPVTKPPSAPRLDTPSQQAANACLALWSLTHADLTGPQAGKYYAAMNKLIEGLAGGAEELQAWAEAEAVNGQRALGAGAKPEAAIPAAVRKEVTAKGWQQSFAAARQATPTPGQRFIRHQDGSIQYEREWEPEQKNSIRIAVMAGTWDEKLGIDRNAPWHPDYGNGASL